MNSNYSRRQFIKSSAVAAGAIALGTGSAEILRADTPAAAATPKRTAVDEVTLGRTGIKTSRLGFGTGSNNGHNQTALGRDGFTKLIHYAYDQGIRLFDSAEAYATFTWMADAFKGLPREKITLQSKIDGKPADLLARIDHHRQVFNTDYVDSMLVHLMYEKGWTDAFKRVMDGFNEAQDKKWFRAKGVSCHSLPALREATTHEWPEVHLVRVNPQGIRTDSEDQVSWDNRNPANDIAPVVAQLKDMKAKGRGIIGMKICGNGQFVTPEDRERSIRFAMARPELDAVVIGFKNNAEIDEAIQRMNAALAA